MRAAVCLPLLLLAAAAEVAGATEIHRCRQADGVIAFQATPCASDTLALGSVPLDPMQEHPDAQRAAREERQRIEAWSRQSRGRLPPSLGGSAVRAPAQVRPRAPSARGGGTGSQDAAAAGCAKARDEREAAYRRDGNRMGFDRRRALQDAVTAACGLR